jgi:hypothetical protein
MSLEEHQQNYQKLYRSVMKIYFTFLTAIDTHMYTKNHRHLFKEDKPLANARDEFSSAAAELHTDIFNAEDLEYNSHITALADKTFGYFDNYDKAWLTKGELNIELEKPEIIGEIKNLKENVSEPIKDNSREKYILALDKKRSEIRSIVSQPFMSIPELPENNIYPHQFMGDKAENLHTIKKEIISATVGMNKTEQEILEIIFSELINSTSTQEYDELLPKAKSQYAAVKEAYAKYCGLIRECYQSNGSIEEIQAGIAKITEAITKTLGQFIGNNQLLTDAFKKLIIKTFSYYKSQAQLRELNDSVLSKKTSTEIKEVEKDVLIIKAEKIYFAKMPSLKAEEIRVNLILNYVDSRLFLPLLTTGLLFIVGTIIDVAILSSPIGWAIISASLLITIAIMASSKLAFQISTISTGKVDYIDLEQIEENSFMNRVIKAIFSDHEEQEENDKTKIQPRTIFNIVSFTLFGLGGITLITLGIFVLSSLSWVLIPVGGALIAVQLPIAIMKIYANKRIGDHGFANPQSTLLTFMPVIISTLATATVIGISIVATITTIGLFPLAISFATAFLIITIPLVAQSIHKYLYNTSSHSKKNDIEKKFKRAVIISSIISAVGATAGFVCLGFGLLSFGFLAIPVALSILFIISCSYLLYKRDKNNQGYDSIPEDEPTFNMELL